MQVVMRQSGAGPKGVFNAGDKMDFPAEQAKALVESHQADWPAKHSKDPAIAPPTPVAASEPEEDVRLTGVQTRDNEVKRRRGG